MALPSRAGFPFPEIGLGSPVPLAARALLRQAPEARLLLEAPRPRPSREGRSGTAEARQCVRHGFPALISRRLYASQRPGHYVIPTASDTSSATLTPTCVGIATYANKEKQSATTRRALFTYGFWMSFSPIPSVGTPRDEQEMGGASIGRIRTGPEQGNRN